MPRDTLAKSALLEVVFVDRDLVPLLREADIERAIVKIKRQRIDVRLAERSFMEFYLRALPAVSVPDCRDAFIVGNCDSRYGIAIDDPVQDFAARTLRAKQRHFGCFCVEPVYIEGASAELACLEHDFIAA